MPRPKNDHVQKCSYDDYGLFYSWSFFCHSTIFSILGSVKIFFSKKNWTLQYTGLEFFLGFLGFLKHPREFWEHISNMLETFGEYVTVHFVAFKGIFELFQQKFDFWALLIAFSWLFETPSWVHRGSILGKKSNIKQSIVMISTSYNKFIYPPFVLRILDDSTRWR